MAGHKTNQQIYTQLNFTVVGLDKEMDDARKKFDEVSKSVNKLKKEMGDREGYSSNKAYKDKQAEMKNLQKQLEILEKKVGKVGAKEFNAMRDLINKWEDLAPREVGKLTTLLTKYRKNINDVGDVAKAKIEVIGDALNNLSARQEAINRGVADLLNMPGKDTTNKVLEDRISLFNRMGESLAQDEKQYKQMGEVAYRTMKKLMENRGQLVKLGDATTPEQLKQNIESWKKLSTAKGASEGQVQYAKNYMAANEKKLNQMLDEQTIRSANKLDTKTIGGLSDSGIKSQLTYWTKLRDEWVLAKKDATELNAVIDRLAAADKSRNDQAVQSRAIEAWNKEVESAQKMYAVAKELSDSGLQNLISKYTKLRDEAEAAGKPTAAMTAKISQLTAMMDARKENALTESLEKMYVNSEKLSDGSLNKLLSQYVRLREEWEADGKDASELTKIITDLERQSKERAELNAEIQADQAFKKETEAAQRMYKIYNDLSDGSLQSLINRYHKLREEMEASGKDASEFTNRIKELQEEQLGRKVGSVDTFLSNDDSLEARERAVQQYKKLAEEFATAGLNADQLKTKIASLEEGNAKLRTRQTETKGEFALQAVNSGQFTNITDMKQAIKDMEEYQKVLDISGEDGKKRYRELGEAIEKVKNEIEGLNKTEKEGAVVATEYYNDKDRALKRNTNGLEKDKKALEEYLRTLRKSGEDAGKMKEVEKALASINKQLAMTGQSAQEWYEILRSAKKGELTPTELRKEVEKMRLEMENTTKGAEDYAQKMQVLRDMDRQLKITNKSLGDHASTLQNAVDRLANYVLVYVGFQKAVSEVEEALQGNVDFSDQMANVQKVTNMTNEELRAMTDSLEQLDTRTTIADLMDLAEQAGKLGLAMKGGTQAIVEFATVGQKIISTIGEDIGGAEAIADLLKINDLVNKDTADTLEKSMERISSAILDVGNKTKASYGDVTEFTKRVGAVGSVAGLNMQQILALGGTYSALGASMEQSATAVNRFMVGLSNKTDEVAAAAHVSTRQLRELIDSGQSFDALLLVINSVKDEGLPGIQRVLQAIGGRVNAQLTSALALLAGNMDVLINQMDIASTGYERATALGNEFDRTNNNLAGTLERVRNMIYEIFVNSRITDAFHFIIKGLYDIIKWTSESTTRVFFITQAIATLTVALLANQVAWIRTGNAMTLATIKSNIAAWFTRLGTVIKGSTRELAIYQLCLGRVSGTAVFQLTRIGRALKAFLASNWLTLLIGAITAIGIAIWNAATKVDALAKKMSEASEAGQKNLMVVDMLFESLEKVNKAYDKAIEKQKQAKENYDRLTKSIQDENGVIDDNISLSAEQLKAQDDLREANDEVNRTHAEKIRLIDTINGQYGTYLGYLISECNSAELVAAAHRKIADALRDEIRQKQINAIEDYAIEQTTEKSLEAAEKLRTKAGKQRGVAGREDEFMDDMIKGIEDIIDSAGKKGKTLTQNQIFSELKKQLGGKYEYTSKVGNAAYTRNAIDDMAGVIMDYIEPFIDREQIVKETTTRKSDLLARESKNKRRNAFAAQNAEQKEINRLIAIGADKRTTDETSTLIEQLKAYINNYSGNQDTITQENLTRYRNVYRKLLKKQQIDLRKTIWGDNATTKISEMSSDRLAALYDKLEKAAGATAEEANYYEIFPDFAEMMQGKDADEAREVLRQYAEEAKAELDKRHMNTGAHWKWDKDGSGGKDKWKQEAKDQYNAYIKELDDYYARQQMVVDRQRADGILSQEEYQHRTEALDKEHYDNRTKLRNMFLKGIDKLYDKEYGDLTVDAMTAIFKKDETEGIAHTRSLIQRLGDAFVDEIKLESDEDQIKILDIMRKHMDAIDKALLENRPLQKVLADFRSSMNDLHLIFGGKDFYEETQHTESEYTRRLALMFGYTSQIGSMTLDEFKTMIAQTSEFADYTTDEMELMYEQLLLLRDNYDQAMRKAASKSIKLNDIRYENGAWYKEQAQMFASYIATLTIGTKEYEEALKTLAYLQKRQNDSNGKSWGQQQKERLESLKRGVEYEQAIGKMGVDNDVKTAKAVRRQAEQELKMAIEFLNYRKSLYNAQVAAKEQEVATLKELAANTQQGTKEYQAIQETLQFTEAELANFRIAQSEAVTEAQEKATEAQKALSEKQADLLAAQTSDIQSWMGMFKEALTAMASAGDQAAEGKAFELAELRAQKALGWITDNARTRTLILKQSGDYEVKYLNQEERILEEIEIERHNARIDAYTKFINDFGEKLSKKITDIFERQAALNDIRTQEQEQNRIIEEEQQASLNIQAAAEANFTARFKSELQQRLEALSQYYQMAGVISQEGGNALVSTMVDQFQQIGSGQKDATTEQVQTQQKTDKMKVKSSEQATAQLISGLNLYSAAYTAMTNDSMSSTEKMEMFVIQAIGQGLISSLTAMIPYVIGTAAADEAGAIAKAFHDLGPIGGAAAIAGITAMIGLALGAATNAVSKSKQQIASATGAGTGKLVTGMLTYAKGRYPVYADGQYEVQGNDGRSYNARYEKELSTGVYGGGAHFGIFSERQPEAVIDGRTTGRVVMDYPAIWRDIVSLSRFGRLAPDSPYSRRMNTYADGNLSMIPAGDATGTVAGDATGTADSNAALASIIQQNNAIMTQLQAQLAAGLSVNMSMFGKNGLHKTTQKMNRYAERYGVE